ncbi:unnamed protein product [Lactuca virosa]|uniref:Uncharacterized protein n=1 Tax=Lactuca virosa TaxID=75947 RepID=A0AAU9MHB3_9ASTR|nr:unnamed protein product [Lactuca virosa]
MLRLIGRYRALCRTYPFSIGRSFWLKAKLGGMQHRMKKRQRPTISKSKEADGSQNPNPTRGQIDEESKVLNGVSEGTTSRPIQVHVVGAEIVDETEGATNLSGHDDVDDSIHNVMTVSLEYQLVKNVLILLKTNLLHAALNARILSEAGQEHVLRVITGSSKSKKAIVEYLETENIAWREENDKTILRIKINGNQKFELMRISLRGLHVDHAMELLKPLVSLAAFGGVLGELKVVTGSERSSNIKRTVIEYLEREKMEWKEENKATLCVRSISWLKAKLGRMKHHNLQPQKIVETPSSSSVNGDDDSAERFGNLTEIEVASDHSEDEDDDDAYNVYTISLEYQLVIHTDISKMFPFIFCI